MLSDILLVFAAFYLVQATLIAVAAALARYPVNRSWKPLVSVIIAARNEEMNIGRCLDSMERLSYPAELLEIVVVDDRSSDRTQSIAREYARRSPHIKVLVASPAEGHLQGKTNAVTQAIEASTGEVILFTDADCSVPTWWVEETVKYYNDDRIGLVAGFTELRATSWFQRMQALDWFFLFGVAAAVIRLRFPATAVGTNLSVRRSAYNATGGYRKIPFSVTEDYALFHAVTSGARLQARFPLDPSTLVQSEACPTWRDLHRQKVRWLTGGKGMDLKILAVFAGSYIYGGLLILSFILIPGPIPWIAAGIRVFSDLLVMLPVLRAFRRWRLLLTFPLFELWYFFYALVYPLIVITRSEVIWKERAFTR